MRTKFSTLVVLALALGLGLFVVGHAEEAYTVRPTELPTAVLEAAATAFQEYKTPEASLLATSANLVIGRETSISIAFVGEGAGYRNSIGFFRMGEDGTVLDQTVVFSNFSGTGPGLAGGGSLQPGDAVDLGSFGTGERVGFFLAANGFGNPGAAVWYTEPGLNRDGKDHDAAVVLEGQGTLIGFEDLTNLGDKDYNDALLFVSITVAPEPEAEAELQEPAEGDESAAQGQAPAEPAESQEPADADDPAPQGQAAEPSLAERVSGFLGLPAEASESLVREFGAVLVGRALRTARDAGEFWTQLYGYEIAMGGSGGGFEAEGGHGSVIRVDFQLFDPRTGAAVQSLDPISLTVVRIPGNEVLEVHVVQYDAVSATYSYELPISSLSSGDYDLYLGVVGSSQAEVLRISIPGHEG
ncbi:MAG: DUF4114 domain-containing protein [Candidatus Bipolaricaulota bacterium]